LSIAISMPSCRSGRNGKQLYISLFGESSENCSQIINFQNHEAFDDASAWLSFKTCPAELKRILSKTHYEKKIITSRYAHEDETITFSGPIPKWWTPSKLGNSCIKYEYYNQTENTARRLYVSIDSSFAYCRDMNMTP
jgi:hypothetical protein